MTNASLTIPFQFLPVSPLTNLHIRTSQNLGLGPLLYTHCLDDLISLLAVNGSPLAYDSQIYVSSPGFCHLDV